MNTPTPDCPFCGSPELQGGPRFRIYGGAKVIGCNDEAACRHYLDAHPRVPTLQVVELSGHVTPTRRLQEQIEAASPRFTDPAAVERLSQEILAHVSTQGGGGAPEEAAEVTRLLGLLTKQGEIITEQAQQIEHLKDRMKTIRRLVRKPRKFT